MTGEESHAAAVTAALEALGAVPYDIDETPDRAWYTQVSVSRRFADLNTRGTQQSGEAYRITTRAVGRTITNARNIRRLAAGLEYQMLTVDGLTTSPIQFETAETIGPDGDGTWFSGLTTWTYTLI